MEAARKKADEAQPKEPQEQYQGLYASHAGPPRPPVFGPEPDPKAERRRKKAEAKARRPPYAPWRTRARPEGRALGGLCV